MYSKQHALPLVVVRPGWYLALCGDFHARRRSASGTFLEIGDNLIPRPTWTTAQSHRTGSHAARHRWEYFQYSRRCHSDLPRVFQTVQDSKGRLKYVECPIA